MVTYMSKFGLAPTVHLATPRNGRVLTCSLQSRILLRQPPEQIRCTASQRLGPERGLLRRIFDVLGQLCLPLWQQPPEFGAMAAYLASPHAHNITGQTINIDGGQVMHA